MTTHVITGCAMPLPKTIFTFISDPGHSWLILSPAWLDAVGLKLADISTFSYQRADGFLALEEDSDAPAFITAFGKMFGDCIDLRETHQDVTEIRNWPHVCHQAGADRAKDVITYEIQRFPMIDDGAGGYTLFDPVDHAGRMWAFIDVSVTKRVNDCLVDEIACVDGIKDIATSDAVMEAFSSAYPTATIEDHLEGVAHLGFSGRAPAA